MEVASTGPAEDGLRDFRAVYRVHYGFVWHALHRFGVAPPVVDDAVQDVFVVAYRRRATYRGPSPKPWLYGIARRVASNYRRSTRRRVQRDQALPKATRPPVDDGTREIIEGLERYLAGLRSEDRELFVLSELEGMTGPELASVTGRNVQTIYTRVRKLKVELGEHVGGLERIRRERPQATARSWALLLPALRFSPAGSVAATASGWGAWWGWAVGAAGAASLALVVTTMPAADRPRLAAERADTGASPLPRPSLAASAADVGEASLAPVPSPIPADDHGASRVPSPGPAASATASAARSDATPVAATSPRSHRDAATDAPTSDGLGVETELLRRASAELTAGNADAALRMAAEHGRRFPDSVLADLRIALRIEALCELGKATQARGEAQVFLRAHPGSPVAERIERACTSASYESAAADKTGA
jgi:RNA polymerase sigma factor (sigma-70 family)